MEKKYRLPTTIKKLLNIAKSHHFKLTWRFIVYTITAGLISTLSTLLVKVIIDQISLPDPSMTRIMMILGGYLIIGGSFTFFSNLILISTQIKFTKIRIDILRDVSNHYMKMDQSYIEDPDLRDQFDLAFNATNNDQSGVEGVLTALFSFFALVLSSIMLIIIILQLSYLVLVAIIISVIISFVVKQAVNKLQYKFKDIFSRISRKRNYYMNICCDFSYGKDIRVDQLKNQVLNKYHESCFSSLNVIKRFKRKELGYGLLEILGILLTEGFIYGFLIYQLTKGLSVADFSMFLAATFALSTSLKEIATQIAYIFYEGAYVTDVFKFLETDFTINQGKLSNPCDQTLDIEFIDVSFKYPKTERYIYQNLSFKINQKEKIAIVGANGVGKTTLVKLITRLFNPTSGKILINGLDASLIDLNQYFEMFSVVLQDYHIGAFSIAQNVALTPNYDLKRVEKCIEAVGLSETVKKLPKGINQSLLKIIDEDGVELSGGESQKIAIARALYKESAKVIILDEPTSALDALAEAQIYQDFNKLVNNKTCLFISHRLASTKFCDRILLFDETGHLTEVGNHQQLMALKGQYYQMFITQGKYYQMEEVNE